MSLATPKTSLHKGISTILSLSALCLCPLPAVAELQVGRDAQGNLWISDQGLPAGIKATAAGSTEVMSLQTPSPTSSSRGTADSKPPAANPQENTRGMGKMNKTDLATCNGIEQRYEGARSSLATVEQKKASGQLLIPDSGLVAMRQNLATLDRLKALCQ